MFDNAVKSFMIPGQKLCEKAGEIPWYPPCALCKVCMKLLQKGNFLPKKKKPKTSERAKRVHQEKGRESVKLRVFNCVMRTRVIVF